VCRDDTNTEITQCGVGWGQVRAEIGSKARACQNMAMPFRTTIDCAVYDIFYQHLINCS
jgi:hypothetical protein